MIRQANPTQPETIEPEGEQFRFIPPAIEEPRKKGKPAVVRTKLSPKELAARWGVSLYHVIRLIKSGELRAIDIAATRGRPRYLIDVADIATFEERRAIQPPPTPTERRRQRREKRAATRAATDGITKFF
jgi:transposase